MTLYLDLATRSITQSAPNSTMVGGVTIAIPTSIDILSALVESVRHISMMSGYVSITIQ